MAQIRILKIGSFGRGTEHDPALDELTGLTFSVTGGGPVLSGTGIDMNGQDVTDISDVVFTDPSVGTVNQTAGALIIDNLMGKERDNVMASGSSILFGSVGDVAGQLDALQMPQSSALPTATPANNANSGYIVSFNSKMYFWTGSAWDDYSIADATNKVINTFTASGAIAIREVVYINGSGTVTLADNDVDASSLVVGFAVAAALDTALIEIQSAGIMGGFTGLTAGAIQYLDGTAGAITSTLPPGASSKNIVQVGYAVSATEIFIDVDFVNRRGA